MNSQSAVNPHSDFLRSIRLWRAAGCAAAWVLACCIGATLPPSQAHAQSVIPSSQLVFKKGSSGTSVVGTLRGRSIETRDYVLAAKAGQIMTVSLATTSSSTSFNVLPPGSSGEAIFVGELTGQRAWTGELPDDGNYVIRVYLNRAAGRQGVSSNYKLIVSLTSVEPEEATEKDAASDYDATGQLPCSMGGAPAGSVLCDYGVKRGEAGAATLDITPPGGARRTLTFSGSRVKAGGGGSVKASKQGDDWLVSVNGYEHYVIHKSLIDGS
ncbi:hypothetical protein QTH91_08155 [Variovorax dokdonensis]|uniref:Uncharacterized protein n=1 Tax=Variovorax dokdonensis TaxID=344883 RepID=A0ABT7N924_9BURK|nr:hypothetical protein [Variovorax dokdonensis]MDM0044447.1 hypothetical protein [Variovorax dokdonensis]